MYNICLPVEKCNIYVDYYFNHLDKQFQLQSTSNVITCIDKRFAVKNSGKSCVALIFNSSNPTMTILLLVLDSCDSCTQKMVAKYD